jgi:sulfate adenylyltransferase
MMSTSLTGPFPLAVHRALISHLLSENRVNEAIKVFGSDDDTHPGVKYLLSTAKDYYVGGKLEAIQRLEHYDFLDLRCQLSPLPLRQ